MDRPFGGRHKSFTVEHAGDERAMKECGEGKDAVAAFLGMRKKAPSGSAQIHRNALFW
jgi:hypothetical protein